MRLHHLRIRAFGPFADSVEVDFDALGAGGLFLLTGDTGAGKTSVLDAVCFALYGEVPGDRSAAKHLRCDQAPPDRAPEVCLELSIGERSFRFTRSPAWDRPKRRGAGTTRVQAHVVVEELRDHAWEGLTHRLDEAGHLVLDLLGMTCTQFTQVAMLPQGRFQAFLRATSADRQDVLQRLFRTRRFEDVEHWLGERRLALHRRSETHRERITVTVNRLDEAAGGDRPVVATPGGTEDPTVLVGTEALRPWADRLLEQAESSSRRAAEELVAADALLVAARDSEELARGRVEQRERGARARRTLMDLRGTLEEEHAAATALEAHQRAAPLRVLTLGLEAAAADVAEVERDSHEPLTIAARLLDLDPDRLDAEVLATGARAAGEARAVAEAWLPREQEVVTCREESQRLASSVALLREQVHEAQERTAAIASSLAATTGARDEVRLAAATLPHDRAESDRAQTGRRAALEVIALTTRLTGAEQELALAVDLAQGLRDHVQDLRESHLSGMAAELAAGLAAGCSCPVCGSSQHPSPAHARASASKADVAAAQRRFEDADFSRQAHAESVATVRTQLAGAGQVSEHHGEDWWSDAADRAAAALARSRTAHDRLATLDAEVDRLGVEHHDAALFLATGTATLEAQVVASTELGSRLGRLESDLADLVGSSGRSTDGAVDVAALVRNLQERATVFEEAHRDWTRRERARATCADAERAALGAVAEAGFESLTQARDAELSGAQVAAATATLERRRAAQAQALAVLEEDRVVEAMAVPPDDLGAERAAVADTQERRDLAQAAARDADRRVARLRTLHGDLGQELSSWEPVRREHELVASIASLAEGRSSENRWRTRLSAYVLSERLRQVVAAANERLGAMTDHRYVLVQVEEKAAGEQRGGLSLRVRDEWSGALRDPATLSGGETFLASLALALGLADTVSHESGGVHLDTLFVDEGFGSLDATTLDGVMDVLDGLRDGGRVVGVVSHVTELRSRVPAQLEVRKSRDGSTVDARFAND